MKKIILYFLLLTVPGFLYAQGDIILSELTTVPIRIVDQNDGISLQWSAGELKQSIQDFRLVSVTDIRLSDADLQIDYVTLHPDPELEYEIGVAVEVAEGILNVSTAKDIEMSAADDRRTTSRQTLIWKDFLEKQADIGDSYLLLIRTNIRGNICASPPAFTLSQRLPYYSAAIIGLGAIGVGQIFKIQSDKEEDRYREIWESGGNATLEQAENDFNTYRTLTYAGLGVLAVDAVLFILRNRKYKKEQKRFRSFCSEKVEIRVHPAYHPSTDLGFMFKINF